jgi:uncharacterized coiled-coil protein SlyX
MTEEVIDSVEDLTRKVTAVEDNIVEISAKFEDTVSTEDFHAYAESLAEMVDGKAEKRDIELLTAKLREKADLSTVEDNFVRREAFDSVFDDTEMLKELVSNKAEKIDLEAKVDKEVLFDENGIIRSSLLPGSVDDIVEGVLADTVFIPQDRDAQIDVGGKLYLDVNTKVLYRWSGTQYVSVSSGNSALVLGTTSGTAYEGSAGKALENAVANLQGSVNNVSADVASQGMRLTASEESLTKLSADVDAHTKTLANVEAKVSSQDAKIADVQADVKAHTSTLAAHDKNIATIQNNYNTLQNTVNSLQTNVNKITQIDSKVNSLEKNISSQSTAIETLNYTVSAQGNVLSEQMGKIAAIDGISTTVEKLSTAFDEQAASISGYSERISVLETTDAAQSNRLGAVEETIVQHGTDIAALKTSEAYQNVQLKKLSDTIANFEIPELDLSAIIDESGLIKSSLLPGYVDDVIEGVLTEEGFIPNDTSAEVAVGGKLYVDVNTKDVYRWSGTQYVKVSGKSLVLGTADGTAYEGSAGKKLETLVATHDSNISVLKKKVNDLLALELPEGDVLNFGTLAFKDYISSDDITSIGISKIVLDDELELYAGDASD